MPAVQCPRSLEITKGKRANLPVLRWYLEMADGRLFSLPYEGFVALFQIPEFGSEQLDIQSLHSDSFCDHILTCDSLWVFTSSVSLMKVFHLTTLLYRVSLPLPQGFPRNYCMKSCDLLFIVGFLTLNGKGIKFLLNSFTFQKNFPHLYAK